MAFQTQSNRFTAPASVGDIVYLGAEPRIQPHVLYHASLPLYIGYAYTLSTAGDLQTSNTATVGGATADFAGIFVKPKEQFSFGTTAGGPLAATLAVPNYTTGGLMKSGHCAVSLPAAAALNDKVVFDTTTGALSTVIHVPASMTYDQSTTTATISSFVAGGTPIGVGSVFVSSTGAYLGTVQSLGTGTGGNGTYVVETSATVSGATATAQPIAGSGKRFVPNAIVDFVPLTAAGIAIITLTN